MNIPSLYDAIRPFEPEELPAAFERLKSDAQFRAVVGYAFPGVPVDALFQKMCSCGSCLDFQKTFSYPFLKQLVAKASTGMTSNFEAIDLSRRHTFVSNHRDIVLDSALLSVSLFDAGCATTCEVAIGDNLLATQWIKDLVRINKSFIVERSVGIREMLASSKRMAEYMHFVINEKHDNIWIAQREGRAKDSNDRTQPALLKMMTLGGTGTAIERLKALRIVPLTISYEYDPCDYLKAREFQLKRDNPAWKKTKADDVESMQTGVTGYKGAIHYHAAPCINEWLDTLPADMPKGALLDAVAAHIDQEIFRHYRLYPINEAAANGEPLFDNYAAKRIEKISIANRDDAYLLDRLRAMYANPYRNHQAAL